MEPKKLDVEKVTREFRELRLSLMRDPFQKIDAEPILRRCAEIRETIPPEYLDPNRPRRSYEGRMEALLGYEPRTPEDFEYFALHEGVQSLADDLQEAMECAAEMARKTVLKVYYAGVELVKDPQNANLIPQLEAIRVGYERDYGHPIPPKPEQ
jgi:hypothetical protein